MKYLVPETSGDGSVPVVKKLIICPLFLRCGLGRPATGLGRGTLSVTLEVEVLNVAPPVIRKPPVIVLAGPTGPCKVIVVFPPVIVSTGQMPCNGPTAEPAKFSLTLSTPATKP